MNEQSESGKYDEINTYYFMLAIIGDVILDIVKKDAMLALFSFAFIVFWLRINTKSWFLAWVGFFEIFFSIPIAWFLFSVVFRIKYFATLNALALFIVAAIGADDICKCFFARRTCRAFRRDSFRFRCSRRAMKSETSHSAVIFIDAYNQSRYHPEILVDLETRMSWVYRLPLHPHHTIGLPSILWNICGGGEFSILSPRAVIFIQ